MLNPHLKHPVPPFSIKQWWQKLRSKGKTSVIISGLCLLLFELLEFLLEEGLAQALSWTFAKIAFVMFGVSIANKLMLKQLIKMITYKGGYDKMDKLKALLIKLSDVLKTNPITIATSAGNIAVNGLVGLLVYIVMTLLGLPESAIYSATTIVPVILASFIEWGILKNGWETKEQKEARLAEKARLAEEKKLEKEAAERLKAEAEEQAKFEAEAKARLAAMEQEKIEAAEAEKAKKAKDEHEAKIAIKMAELQASGWTVKK